MNRSSHLLTEAKRLGVCMRRLLCGLLVMSVMLSSLPLVGFGRASNAPTPMEEQEEQQHVVCGCETRTTLRRALDRPFHLALKGRIGRFRASNTLRLDNARQGHRLPNGLMAPLRC